jgi:hypothetical protein
MLHWLISVYIGFNLIFDQKWNFLRNLTRYSGKPCDMKEKIFLGTECNVNVQKMKYLQRFQFGPEVGI